MAKNVAVEALQKPTAQHGRNNFPLDNKHVYSIKAGQITPIHCMHYEPGTYLDIKASDFTMTFPMQTAPFMRGRKETAFYSVYYNAVWSLYNQYQAQKNDPKTSAFGKSPTLVEPRISIFDFYEAIIHQFYGYIFYEYFIEGVIRRRHSDQTEEVIQSYILDAKENFLSGTYNYQQLLCGTTYIDVNSNEQNIQLLGSYYNSYANIDFSGINDYTPNSSYYQDIVGHWRVYNWIRKLDMLGYGNLYGQFNSMERSIATVTSETSTTDQGYYEIVIDALANFHEDLFKLAFTFDGTVSSPTNVVATYVNLYPICAYNSIFYHFFRNSFYDLDYLPRNYNLDFVSVEGTADVTGIVQLKSFSIRFLDIEYHQWKKDTFTGVLPDTQFGAVSSIDINTSGSVTISGSTGYDAGRYIYTNGNIITTSTAVSTRGGSASLQDQVAQIQHTHLVSGTGSISGVSFDVIAMKRAEMLQDYRQTLMRAGNRTSDVFKAIYGGAPSSEHEDDVIPRFLDTFGEDIFVDPVIATADTGQEMNGKLGDIASRGKFSGQSGHIKFNAGSNFGLILPVTYFVPTAEYNSYMFDKHVFELTPEAHFIPQFENLGLEPIYSDELNSNIPRNDIAVLGYGPRYYHKKSEVDLVHGAFISLAPFRKASNVEDGLYYHAVDNTYYGEFNNWVSPRTDMQARKTTAIRDFYVNPSVLDNVFVMAAGADISQDQFICNTYFEVNATKQLSKIGLINFV